MRSDVQVTTSRRDTKLDGKQYIHRLHTHYRQLSSEAIHQQLVPMLPNCFRSLKSRDTLPTSRPSSNILPSRSRRVRLVRLGQDVDRQAIWRERDSRQLRKHLPGLHSRVVEDGLVKTSRASHPSIRTWQQEDAVLPSLDTEDCAGRCSTGVWNRELQSTSGGMNVVALAAGNKSVLRAD